MPRQEPRLPPLAQRTFVFEEIALPATEGYHAKADVPLMTQVPPEYVPVYTVFLRRSEVLTVQERPRIQCPQEVAALVWQCVKETDRETFVVVMLDTKNNVIGLNIASIGILDSALVHPREVFKPAILANAVSIILAHNHPSGDPSPSAEDKRITQRLQAGGQLLGIEVQDHIILGENGRFVSLKERGVL